MSLIIKRLNIKIYCFGEKMILYFYDILASSSAKVKAPEIDRPCRLSNFPLAAVR